MGTCVTVVSSSRWVFWTAIAASALSLTGCAPSNREDCLADAAKAPTESGVSLAADSCVRQFPSELRTSPQAPPIASENKTRELCYVYWDGGRWKKGKSEGDLFKRFMASRYGVELIEISIPLKMVDDLKINESNLFDEKNTKAAEWRGRYWYQVEALCDLI